MTRVVGDGDPLPEPVGPPTGPEDCLRLELPSGKGETRADLTRRQLDDNSLTNYWTLAESKLRGYEVRDGLLVHVLVGELGEEVVRIVVPREDRERLLGLAHEFGGHLGVKKMKSKLNRLFTWPGLSGDVTRYVSACQLCATHNRGGGGQTC